MQIKVIIKIKILMKHVRNLKSRNNNALSMCVENYVYLPADSKLNYSRIVLIVRGLLVSVGSASLASLFSHNNEH